MKAVGLYRYLPIEDPESLVDVTVPDPVPGDRDLLVAVRAVSVNPVDTKQRAPKEKVEKLPRVLGWDAAGVVQKAGPGCTLFKPGDEVYYAGSITRPGCYSELQVVDERIVGRKPGSVSFAEAAALPLTTITAWEALFDRMHLEQSEKPVEKSILVVGGAGGVGSIATQLAKRVAGLTVIATASRPESREWCIAHGADLVVDHTADIPVQIRAKGFKFVDYIFCLNSVDMHFPALVEIVAPLGWICSIVGSSMTPDVKLLFDKSAGFSWELMFTRPKYGTDDMIEQHRLLDRVSTLVDAGVIRTTLSHRFSPINAENLRKAHRMIESGHTIGKIVIEGFS